MALFSDVDWIVILAVAAFLLFGSQGQQTVRTLGRLYGRAMRLKSELLSEVTSGMELPIGGNTSLRAAILGDAPIASAAPPSTPVPVPLTAASMPGIVTQVAPVTLRTVETVAFGAAMGPGLWSVAVTSAPGEVVHLR